MKIIKKSIIFSMLLSFTFLNAADSPSDVVRDLSNTNFQNLKDSEISDLPYAEYFESIPRDINIILTNNKDLSKYQGKQIYVGYGLYDRDNSQYCKYLPLKTLYPEGATVPLLEEEFYNFKTKSEHSYAMSKVKMNYETCLQKGERYGGYPVVIEKSDENEFVKLMARIPEQSTDRGTPDILTELTGEEFIVYKDGLDGPAEEFFEIVQLNSNDGSYTIKEYSKNPRSALTIEGVWLGMHKKNNNCSEEFIYQTKYPSEYENWSYQEPNCSNDNETSIILDSIGVDIDNINMFRGQWKDVSKNEQYHCLLEFESRDPKKPYKICAPWWKVDREYDNTPTSEEMLGFDFAKYDKSTLPKSFRVCSKYDLDVTSFEDLEKRKVSCSSYYFMKKYDHCMNDPLREVCKVNECSGYIADTCDLVETVEIEEPMKNYVKEIMLVDGVPKDVKVKDKLKTYIYECPPSPPSKKTCLAYSEFLIFPATCSDGTRLYGTKLRYYGMGGHPDSPGKTGELDVVNSFEGNCPVE